jgi:hypothetical protein
MEKNTVSIWNKTAEKAFYPRLTESLDADVLIIGGGITGVTCAYCLGKRGRSSVLIEAGGLCDGTTGNTTGKVTAQHGAVYAGLAKKHGPGAARDYARSQTEGLELVRRAAADEGIDCQLADSPACVFAAEEGDVEAVEKEYEAERRAGLDVELVENPWFPVKNLRMARCRDQYVFHPVRYVEGLAAAAAGRGARICCGAKAFKVEDGQMITVRARTALSSGQSIWSWRRGIRSTTGRTCFTQSSIRSERTASRSGQSIPGRTAAIFPPARGRGGSGRTSKRARRSSAAAATATRPAGARRICPSTLKT